MILWKCVKTMQVRNFLLLNETFFCCQVKMTEHQTTHFSTSLYYTLQQLNNSNNNHEGKSFHSSKRLNHIPNLQSQQWFSLFSWMNDWMIYWLIDCLIDWLTDWLIDWLTDKWPSDNESTDQQTDWLNIFMWLLLVFWITCILGMHFKFKIKCSTLCKSANSNAF